MKPEKFAAAFFAAVIVLGLAGSAGAVDGTIEINQAKMLAAGGSPFSILTSGSYRLTSSLKVLDGNGAIVVFANDITIDLNGFSISGPGSGVGISVVGAEGLTVENGTITGFSTGVSLRDQSIVKSVHADSNTSTGITVGKDSVVEGCTANNNNGHGIVCGSGCTISGNTANGNITSGISVGSASLVVRNTVSNATNSIVASDSFTGYGENVFDGEGNVSGGTSMKNNVCGGSLC